MPIMPAARRMLARFGVLAAVLAVPLALGGAGTDAATGGVHAPASDPDGLTPPVFRRQVQIDGRFITVQLLVRRTIPGAPLVGGSRPTTTAEVELWVQDGALLPAGLSAKSVRFQKQFGRREVFFTPLVETLFTTQGFELDGKAFNGNLVNTPNAQRLGATVRLSYNGRIISVPMGVVSVWTVPLP